MNIPNCFECGYSYEGLDDIEVCPECGSTIEYQPSESKTLGISILALVCGLASVPSLIVPIIIAESGLFWVLGVMVPISFSVLAYVLCGRAEKPWKNVGRVIPQLMIVSYARFFALLTLVALAVSAGLWVVILFL